MVISILGGALYIIDYSHSLFTGFGKQIFVTIFKEYSIKCLKYGIVHGREALPEDPEHVAVLLFVRFISLFCSRRHDDCLSSSTDVR